MTSYSRTCLPVWMMVLLSVTLLSDRVTAQNPTCFATLPSPVAAFVSKDQIVAGFDRYNVSITNWQDFPAELFAASPDLPPCGFNSNSSRTWVTIFTQDGTPLNTFCGLGTPQDLTQIWFGLPQGNTPPQAVYVVLTDRRCNLTYQSGLVPLAASAPTITATPAQLIFTNTDSILPLRITNSGDGILNLTAKPSVTGFNASDFIIADGTTCTNGIAVAPGDSCNINISFVPITSSAESASLSLFDNATNSPQIIGLSGGATLASMEPNPVTGSDNPQIVTITGTAFTSDSVINWEDLTNGGSGSVIPLATTPNVITASMTFGHATATWQIRVTNSEGLSTNWYTFQVLAPDVLHSYANDYPFQNAPYCPNSTTANSCADNTKDPYIYPNGFFYRECTSFVAWRMNRDAGTTDPRNPSFFNRMGNGKWGFASNWKANANSLGYLSDQNPEVGAIAQWVNGCGGNCSHGHVAYVEAVNIDGSVDVSEYNYASDDNKVAGQPGDHQFGIRTLFPKDATFPQSFIHIRRISLSSNSLLFGNQPLGTSVTQPIIVTNPGPASVSFASTTLGGKNGGDFQVSGCTAGPPLGGTCEIDVTFVPSAAGPRAASVTLVGNAGTQIIELAGTGLVPLSFSPKTVSFGNTALGATSGTKVVTLTNHTGTDLNIASIATESLEFEQSSTTCGATLPYKASCTISLIFVPASIGPRSATLTIIDSAIDSPQLVTVTGTGILPVVVSPATLTFAARAVGTTSLAKVVQIKNNLPVPLAIVGASFGGPNPDDFKQDEGSTTCGSTLASGAMCVFGFTFSPIAHGDRQAVLNILDSAGTSPQTITVSGTGK